MKKATFIFSCVILTAFFISCANSSDNIVGDWIICNDGSAFCTITKQGKVFNLHINRNESDWVLEKKSEGLFTGANGMITVRYDEKSNHLFVSAIGEKNRELCGQGVAKQKQLDGSTGKEKAKEEKWEIFWADFRSAFNAKDIAKISALTSKEFNCPNCEGSDIKAWLSEIAFVKDESFNQIKKMLNQGVKNENGGKVTGNGGLGAFIFEYKEDKWLFRTIMWD